MYPCNLFLMVYSRGSQSLLASKHLWHSDMAATKSLKQEAEPAIKWLPQLNFSPANEYPSVVVPIVAKAIFFKKNLHSQPEVPQKPYLSPGGHLEKHLVGTWKSVSRCHSAHGNHAGDPSIFTHIPRRVPNTPVLALIQVVISAHPQNQGPATPRVLTVSLRT